jgi:cytochrome c2
MHKFIGFACVFALGATLTACGGPKTPEQDSNQAAETALPAADETVNQSVTTNATEASATPVAAQSASDTPPAFAQCKACHSAEPGENGIGPSLAGVFGTMAAEVAGFSFSAAMQKSGLTWDEATLDRYLTAPQKVVPGTKMTFPGIKDDTKRAAVIAYLKSIK